MGVESETLMSKKKMKECIWGHQRANERNLWLWTHRESVSPRCLVSESLQENRSLQRKQEPSAGLAPRTSHPQGTPVEEESIREMAGENGYHHHSLLAFRVLVDMKDLRPFRGPASEPDFSFLTHTALSQTSGRAGGGGGGSLLGIQRYPVRAGAAAMW